MTGREMKSRLQLSPDNPWPGLESFDEASEAFFFGMRTQTDALLRLARRATLTLFYGRSGLGKTSLLLAGLFPRLREANLLPVPIRLDYGREAGPFVNQVKKAVAVALSNAAIDARPPEEAESLWEYFHRSDVDFWDSQNRLVTLVLVFDQFEERFTLGRRFPETNARADIFLTELSQLVENRPPPLLKASFEAHTAAVGNYDFDKHSCKVILSMREDFLAELENLRDRFPSILDNTLRLQAMTEAQANEVVLGPGGQLVTEQVAAEIARFVGGVDPRSQSGFTVEPVLLSVVLYGLNERRRENGQPFLTSDLLSGSREEILARFYEDALRELPAAARVLVEDGLLTSSGRRDTLAWEDALAEFGVNEKDVLTLIDRHLLRREDRSDGARIELVHDRMAEVVRKHRDSRRDQESKARALGELQARQAELEREKEIQRRKARRLLVACIVLALFGLLVSGYLIWDRYQHRWRHETYFSNFTQRFGIFEGIGALTREQASRRSPSFRFVQRGASGPLIRVDAVDSKLKLTHRHSAGTYIKFKSAVNDDEALGVDDNPSRDCQWEFVQDGSGRIVYELAYDKSHRLVWGLAYSPSYGNSLQNVAHFVGPDGLPSSQTASAAEYIRIEYWPNGLEKQLSYFDRTGTPRIGLDGAYAIFYSDYDSLGLPKRVVAMDANGEPMPDKEGKAITEFIRDSKGNLTEEIALDSTGEPVLTNSAWCRHVSKYDDNGNAIETAYFDTNGKKCLTREDFSRSKAKYDEHGNLIESAFFDMNDRPCLNKYGFASARCRYDDHGNMIESSFFDTGGKPCLSKQGLAKGKLKYDDHGNKVESTSFDTNGQPFLNTATGSYRATLKYDDRSNYVEGEFYGLDGKRCLNKEGFARAIAEYDKRGNQVTAAFFGLVDQPTVTNTLGVQKIKMSYDERGNCIAWEYLGLDGKRCLAKNGYAQERAKYDERGNQVETAFFDEDGKSVRNSAGVARYEMTYDQRGNQIASAYFDEEGKPVRDRDGIASFTATYDERGNKIEVATFDEGGKLAQRISGFARMTANHDEHGNVISEAYFDERGRPVKRKEGYARLAASYDERGNQIERAYFDVQGKPVRDDEGFSRLTASYDERGNEIAMACFDERGAPVRASHGVALFTACYDQRGNQIERASFDEKGNPLQRNEGYARFTASYDERGNRIAGYYFDENGKPVRTNEGLARFTASYDQYGNQIASAYFDERGKPVRNYEGFAGYRASYDIHAKQLSIEYYNEDGKSCLCKDGYAKATSRYDERGHQVERAEFNLDGKSTVKSYNLLGEEIEEFYCDEKGNRTANSDGIIRWTASYTNDSYPSEKTYYDHDGKPTPVEIYLAEVLPSGQAKKAGLLEGDVLASYDGRLIQNDAELVTWLNKPGDTTRDLVVLRRQHRLSFAMKPGKLGVLMKGRIPQSQSELGSNALQR